MKPEIKSVTIWVRDTHFELFLQGQYDKVVWTLTPGDPSGSGYFSHKQVQVQISTNTYYQLLDIQNSDPNQQELPF